MLLVKNSEQLKADLYRTQSELTTTTAELTKGLKDTNDDLSATKKNISELSKQRKLAKNNLSQNVTAFTADLSNHGTSFFGGKL
jgi:hypothetical protein